MRMVHVFASLVGRELIVPRPPTNVWCQIVMHMAAATRMGNVFVMLVSKEPIAHLVILCTIFVHV